MHFPPGNTAPFQQSLLRGEYPPEGGEVLGVGGQNSFQGVQNVFPLGGTIAFRRRRGDSTAEGGAVDNMDLAG
jgi:hypothetical protein